ncbi:carboxymuconolactone decarboxylase family protein [Desulfolucanica intricata]|uniref:carboxymuconolactone decarboxylase family protein n=1 Tax=Desulfolucanica intricata TaxID=1285191 RepID=UPI000835AB5C|nr:carboxymuconolactone decarboxylase family protein [Desulfolucanica intricata]
MTGVKKILNDLMNGTGKVARQQPELTQSFMKFTGEVFKEGALSLKHKELTALAIGIYARCEYCIVHHVYAALQAGATPEEIMEAAGVAMTFGGGPSMAYTVTLVRESIEAFAQK